MLNVIKKIESWLIVVRRRIPGVIKTLLGLAGEKFISDLSQRNTGENPEQMRYRKCRKVKSGTYSFTSDRYVASQAENISQITVLQHYWNYCRWSLRLLIVVLFL
jgi:hypothetical protein